MALTASGAFSRELEIPPLAADFIGQFDGTPTLHNLIFELAQRMDADQEKVTKECSKSFSESGSLTQAIE